MKTEDWKWEDVASANMVQTNIQYDDFYTNEYMMIFRFFIAAGICKPLRSCSDTWLAYGTVVKGAKASQAESWVCGLFWKAWRSVEKW